MKILLIDNYDSFTFNLYHYISSLNAKVDVVRNDKINSKEIKKKKYDKIVISPGPGNPNQSGNCINILKSLHKEMSNSRLIYLSYDGTPLLENLKYADAKNAYDKAIMFNEKYKKFHLGNICEDRFKDIVFSDDYWEVMNRLASPSFNAQTMCGTLCLQHKFNEAIDNHVKGISKIEKPKGPQPQHINFI